ncbi:hypothetical protein ACWCRC_43370, partial [Streptomyces sp. NPDC001940]
ASAQRRRRGRRRAGPLPGGPAHRHVGHARRAPAVSTTIVDVSPFSTNGALVLSNARGVERRGFYRQVLGYTCGIVAAGPVVAWGALVLPWS